jgi:hypothetical protein
MKLKSMLATMIKHSNILADEENKGRTSFSVPTHSWSQKTTGQSPVVSRRLVSKQTGPASISASEPKGNKPAPRIRFSG